ncbi:histone acetyltransferase KAT7 [Culicoides brevitarsis]|uniref:histone acetyltransferase KAT7 n=1 Tax=Culicoides brevitarsis TaxID=469753 RepID=UPI00307BDA85
MGPRKKSTSSTESSSSSTDSNSNSSSNSSSESGSDSDSSSSDSSSSSSAFEEKNSKVDEKNVRRRSQDSTGNKTQVSQQSQQQGSSSQNQAQKPKEKAPILSGSVPAKVSHKRSSSASSLDDSYEKNKAVAAVNRKKMGNPSAGTSSTMKNIPPITGGKVPPSVIKQQQQLAQQQNASNGNLKPSAGMKAAAQQKHSAQSQRKSTKNELKKKGHDLSASSDSDAPPSSKPIQKPKERRSSINTSTSAGTSSKKSNSSQPQQSRGRGRPRKNPLPNSGPPKQKIPTSKEIIPSSTSSSTDSSSSDSDSESESSISSVKTTEKTPTTKKPAPTNHVNSSNHVNDTDVNKTPAKTDPAKKFTRSSSTRKSRHLLGKYTDTEDSDGSTTKSISKSPAKSKSSAFYLAKFNSKKSIDTKPKVDVKQEPEQKRICPFEDCDSKGHLGGVEETHFTVEACPKYHKVSIAETKAMLAERKKRDEERKKAIEMFDKTKKILTMEQKMYQAKVKEARSRFKSPTNMKEPEIKDEDRDREPNLKGFVPEYDYQLFRQAQCAASENIENELKLLPASKGTKYITMGKHCMQVWYQSPYPEDVARLPKLYLCEFCLRYQKCAIGMKRHAAKCLWRHPPGDEIYRKGKLGVWQIDGKRQKQYCQFLCLLAKFFLDHKTLYYDVEPFLFYVMTIADADGCHTIGYFSKEKNSFLNYNVSCILTLPPYQRKGYGRLLIDFSYLLTRVEGKIGSPEKPLSDLGLISYRSYWKDVLLNYLCSRKGNTLNIKDISQEMAINSYDIVSTLQALGMMKYWKGKHIILKKQDVLEEYQESLQHRGNFPKIDPSCLKWIPWIQHNSTPS